jgi:hypothetical protein
MTRPAPESLRHPLERQHRRRQRALLWRHALRGATACAVVLALAVLLGVLFLPGVAAAWTRLAAVAIVCALAIGAAARRFTHEGLPLGAYLERVEERFPHLKSWIRNAVDFERTPPSHVSPDLARALHDEARRRLEHERIEQLNPRIAPRRPALVMASALVLMTLAGLLWPDRTQRSWATLWNPQRAMPPVRLEVEPGSVSVTPGAALAVRARVWGTSHAPRLERVPGAGQAAVSEGYEPGGARVWRFDLAQLTRAQDYWVKVGGATSPRYRIALSGTLAPVGFEIEYRSPAYARMPAQRGTSSRGDLTALRGTQATLVVTFDRDLESLEARLPGSEPRRWTALTPRRWQGVLAVDRDGEYELAASARGSSADPPGPLKARFRYRMTALADAPPVLVVQQPQGDMDLPTGQQIPLDLLGQDDLGLTELTLQVRRDPEGPWKDLPLTRFPARPRDARFESSWDASPLGLLPGQSASFRFVLFDDNAVSGRGRAVSPTFELRFPSLADLYQGVDERQAGAQRTLERVAEQARELQKTLDKLARQQPRQESPPSSSFERSEELRSAMQRQTEVGRQIDEATEGLRRSLEQAAERQAFDQELMRKMREVHELLQQIQSPEFKEAMRKMQQALENLDRRSLERQIPEWRAENRELIENLERTLELLKKLREEERLQSLAQRAQELKAQQDELNRDHQKAPEASRDRESAARQELAQRQERAAQESKDLGQEIRDEAEKSDDSKSGEEMKEASRELSEQAAPSQEEASRSAAAGNDAQAQRSGAQASESLDRAAKRMKAMEAERQAEKNQLDLAAVRRAAQDLVSLQRASEGNMGSSLAPRMKADRQTDLSEGTSRVADSLFQLSRQTPFISPRLAETLGRAINGLGESGRELANGNRARGEEAGRQAAQSLNEAVLELRSAENSMCQNPGLGQAGKPNPRRLGEISQQQSELNQQTRSVAQRLTEQMRLSTGDREQLDRLAREQERIRRELEEIRKEDESKRELLGRLNQTEREMKEVEEVMRQGAVDGTLEERQQRILSRLLDAQRSVNRRDYDPERESRPGEDVARRSPSELPAELLRQGDRFRQDLLKSELDRYPAQYRAFVEAYLRLLNGSRR